MADRATRWGVWAAVGLVTLAVSGGIGLTALGPEAWLRANIDRITTVGVVFGAGALLFAIVGTTIAIIAYLNSVKRPRLIIHGVYAPGIAPNDPLQMTATEEDPWGSNSAWQASKK